MAGDIIVMSTNLSSLLLSLGFLIITLGSKRKLWIHNRRRFSDLLLSLFLNNKRVDLVDGRERLHHQDLATNLREFLIQSYEELENVLHLEMIKKRPQTIARAYD